MERASLDLWHGAIGKPVSENPDYLTQQLLTYIGNKRKLLEFIGRGVRLVQKRLGREGLSVLDAFAGSGVVARYLRRYSEHMIVNDLEQYSAVINRCYLISPSAATLRKLRVQHQWLRERLSSDGELEAGIIARYYAPKDDDAIRPGERVFYTQRNARFLDTARMLLEQVPEDLRHFFLGPLLSEASVHVNTSGVFKGFYKNSQTGIGQFGGANSDALARIKGDIELPFPVFSNFDVETQVFQRDANALVREVDEVDLAYIDPPYNQHPYGSNYFMLNLLVDYSRPQETSLVSGIPANWNRSGYNKKSHALGVLTDLIRNVKAKFLLVSFNSEGFVGREEMLAMLEGVGRTDVLETPYNTFRGSRNLRNRSIHVKEYLFLVEKRHG